MGFVPLSGIGLILSSSLSENLRNLRTHESFRPAALSPQIFGTLIPPQISWTGFLLEGLAKIGLILSN
jgi:hypothetical protein